MGGSEKAQYREEEPPNSATVANAATVAEFGDSVDRA